ncbi:VOC family protein [Lentzea nigeriaca]|uniref:VOC family protein n=1 Tax=Lentzea nigeriaca TaxID=1128665 RepID=UPI00195CA0A8|nr:VOC family protein [Lentzea nigeriaca]MBM7860032.1 putative enzyme related to lactoylglutathione lyase [Lentzea nigeriaca]
MSLTIAMITIDTGDARKLAEFWTAALNTTVQGDWGEFIVLAPNSEHGVALGLQQVPDATPGKNRVHFDSHVPDRKAEVARLVGLGATEVAVHSIPGLVWSVLADPDGNEFCVGQAGEELQPTGNP